MKWVKASERMPGEGVINIKLTSHISGVVARGVGLVTKGKISNITFLNRTTISKDEIILTEVEWLDESSSPGGWVSVEDDFPDSGQNVFLYHKEYGLGIGYGMTIDKSFAGTFHGIPVIDESKGVTHWQPLPQPPKQ